MIFQTKYDPGDEVYTIVGSDAKARIVSPKISSIDNVVMAISGIKVTYNLSVSRKDTDTYVNGMPEYCSVQRTEDSIYGTFDECLAVQTEKLKRFKK